MIRRGLKLLLPACLILIFAVAPLPAAQSGATEDSVEVTLDFQNVELVDMISTISELTGENFIYDEAVRGKVSVISPKPVTLEQAYRLFKTVLNVKGFTIVPSGKANKIVPIRTAKEENLPISSTKGVGEQYITHLIGLDSLDAKTAVETILRPLMPKTSHVVAHVPTNTVIITDSAANIERMSRLLKTLDRAWENERMEILPLQFSQAEETSALVMQILEGGEVASGARQARRAQAETGLRTAKGQVIPYERTNKLLIIGDDSFIGRVKKIVVHLDEKADEGRSRVQVYYLENAEAEGLAETLNRILTGVKQQSKPAVAGQKKAATEMFGEVSITADKPTNSLIVNATNDDYDGIKDLIGQLDIKRKQVFVEALILELTMDAVLELGASLQGAADINGDSVTFGSSNLNTGSVSLSDLSPGTDTGTSPSLLTQAVGGLLLGGLFNPISVEGPDGTTISIPALSALIQLSESSGDVNVLSAPRLLTSDNEEAEIIVGANVPIITSKTKDTAGQQINSVERQDVALTLRITPQITEGDLVRLQVYQEISDLAPTTQSVGTVDEVGPTFTKRLLRSSIVARDGKTVVLGGLFQTNRQESLTKIPLLGDIPWLGALFRNRSESEVKTSLLIFITPRVIRSSADMDRITQENTDSLNLFNSEGGSEKFFELNGKPIGTPLETFESDEDR